jgi:excinuclease ABC subunit C
MGDLSQKVLNLPALPGVYVWKGARGEVLYVGKAKSLADRTRSYLQPDFTNPRTRELMDRAADIDTIVTDTEVEALLLELSLIQQYMPPYNVLLKDDKSFPYVRISVQEEFPRLSVTRQVRNDGARYLGPYTDVRRLRRTLREIRRVFPIRTCRDFEDHRKADRPCLYYHIRRCMGPCTRRAHVDPVEYRGMVDSLLLFLSGRDVELVRRLRQEMEESAEARRYEVAARRRDQIALLERARVPQKMMVATVRDTDILGLARHGSRAAVVALIVRGGRVLGKETRMVERASGLADEDVLHSVLSQHYLTRAEFPARLAVSVMPAGHEVLREALERRGGHAVEIFVPQRGRHRRLLATAERNAAIALEDLAARQSGRRARYASDVLELQRALGLASPPYRMVCFDISNLGAEGAVAAVVASENGRPRTSLYRRMRIRTPGPDDFAMIREAVQRYWARVESDELPRPDLVVIDGGAGQLSAARAGLEQVSTADVPLIALAKREEEIVREGAPPLHLPRRSPALRSLQRVRDEAHRFGLDYHRRLRSRARIASEIDAVSGVGPARRAALLGAFGSISALRAAAPEDAAERARAPLDVARRVIEHLRTTAPAGTATSVASDDDAVDRADDGPRRAAGGGHRA